MHLPFFKSYGFSFCTGFTSQKEPIQSQVVAIGTRGRGSRGRGRRLVESTGPTNTEIERNKRNIRLIDDFFTYFVDIRGLKAISHQKC